ncbi:MAG TPA: hypothetical protein RMH99_05360 [Sandaracinaceae bacterium LLY-WYZ-13_1]|nr:hypothetical protein [Sandaracinaceae bacterium LLY-WYZ-13_1]
MESRNRFAAGVVAILVAGTALELLRVIFGVTAPQITEGHSDFISIVLAVLWGASALLVAARHRASALAIAAWVGGIASTFAMLAHGLLLQITNAPWLGIAYLAATPLLGLFAWKTLHGEYDRLRDEARGH